MPHETEILFNEAGIQYQGVNDASGGTGAYPIQGLIVGQFKRGRLDKPMTIHRDNIKAMLGYDPKNSYYTAVQDILNQGVPNVAVLRILSSPPPVIEPEPPIVEPPIPEENVPVKLFDYAVVRYIWTPQGGTDLDTRTSIIDPPRNNVVGWAKGSTDENFLTWVGDNTGSGIESVLIDITALKSIYPNKKTFIFQFKAFWYATRASGDFRLEIETYQGGQMIIGDGYNYYNEGGVLVQNLTMNCYVGDAVDHEGISVAQLSLDLENKTGRFLNQSEEQQQARLSLISKSGISIFDGYLSQLRLVSSEGRILYDGSAPTGPLVLRNSSDSLLFMR